MSANRTRTGARRAGVPSIAVAAGVVVFALAACGAPPSPAEPVVATGSSTTAASTISTGAPTAPAEVDDLAAEFLTALGAGGADASWGLLSPASQQAFGDVEAWRDNRTGYAEGLAAFGADGITRWWLPWVADEFGVLVLSGEVEREGVREFGAFALPVARSGDGWRVELTPPAWSDALRIEVPRTGGGLLPPTVPVTALVPVSGGGSPAVHLNSREVVPRGIAQYPVDQDTFRMATSVETGGGADHVITLVVKTPELLQAQSVVVSTV